MTSICFYFQVHQPFRLKDFNFFKIGSDHFYENDNQNKELLYRIADKSYLPANQKILDLIHQSGGKFRVSYSISGTALEQFEAYRPDVIESFRDLVKTGCVEILAETYYHSLSFLYSKSEFERQVKKHSDKVKALLGVEPKVFRNTELIYNNDIAAAINKMGYKAILCEGVDRILNERSPNFVYKAAGSGMNCLLKNYKLSDDIAFRFSNQNWDEYPLTAPKFANWVHSVAGNGEVINLFMDYETFGEHQWAESGIFRFLEHLPMEVLKHPDFDFKTPSEIVDTYPAKGVYDAPFFTSWADEERDLSAWLENSMQGEAIKRIYNLEQKVLQKGQKELVEVWGKLQTSDHFYYMSTKFWNDGDVHKYFSPYDSPFDAYINYMNVLSDFELCI
ncbi:MAG TPA: glycoside hydrolase family 57 protein [Cytophagales bacterium]|nr:glycoside hydrolase family 57 protein [Cytophagales bacterium]